MSAPDSETPKSRSLEARLARGFGDREAADIAATARMMEKIREVYELYGFEAVETPFVEYTDSLGKFLPDQDRPNEGVFSFQDDDGQWLSLRYDLTAPLARYYAENHERLPKPYRSYRAGWVFRNEKPGPGRFRQFMQFDADTVGAPSVAADAEICMMAADTLEALGIKRGDYVIKVNNRKVLDGIMEAAGLGGEGNAGQRLTVLRAIDKLDRLGPEGVRALLGAGRKDESGDFTKGAGLEPAAIEMILAFTAARGMSDAITLDNLDRVVADSAMGREGVAELRLIADLVATGGYAGARVAIDPAVVRGLEYYTGPVYEAELTFQVNDEAGRPIRFGSVGGGGRYDGLVSRFLPDQVPSTGFSIGVSRLLSALKAVKSPLVTGSGTRGPVIVLAMDKAPEALAGYLTMVADLRRAGIRAEMYLGGANMKQQLKYADRRHSVCVVIQGSNERAAGQALVKDLVLGADLSKIADRAEYLRKQSEVQFPVATGDIVAGVRKVLARHGAA